MKEFQKFFRENLQSLHNEINSFEHEEDLWEIKGTIKNPPANIAMHMCGNLKHYIGHGIGNNGYIRNRDLEFSIKGLSKEQILNEINSTIEALDAVFEKLTYDDLLKNYEHDYYGENKKIAFVLSILSQHLGYHLGQINYYRRLI